MARARREHGLRAIEAARKALAMQGAEGNDPRRGAAVNRARGEAIAEGHRRNCVPHPRHWEALDYSNAGGGYTVLVFGSANFSTSKTLDLGSAPVGKSLVSQAVVAE